MAALPSLKQPWVLLPRDARVVVFGILGVLILAVTVVTRTGPQQRLLSFVRTLPTVVSVVVVHGGDAAGGEALARGLLGVPALPLPDSVRPLASLVVGDAAVALLPPAAAARAGLAGLPVGGLTAVGPSEALEELGRAGQGVPVSPVILRFLRQSSGPQVLVRDVWLRARVRALGERLALRELLRTPLAQASAATARPGEPVGALAAPGDRLVALSLEGDSRRFRVRGVLEGDFRSLGAQAHVLLRSLPDGALLVVDGVPADELLPEELPPLLDALREESGVGEELRGLARVVGAQPLLLALAAGEQGSLEVSTAFERPQGIAETELEARLRSLLERRLALTAAVVEAVPVDGRVVRHQRPRERAERPLLEEPWGDWRILTAPRALGATDLAVALHDHLVLLGTSRPALVELIEHVRSRDVLERARAHAPGGGEPDIRVWVDGERLRRLPVVARALAGLPADAAGGAGTLETVRLDITARAGELALSITAQMAPLPDVL